MTGRKPFMRITKKHLTIVLSFAIALLLQLRAWSQSAIMTDTGYYVSYPDKLTARLYLSQKYAGLQFPKGQNDAKLEYRSNSKLSLGAGFTWKSLTVNLSYGFNALNKDEEKGATKGLDLQMNVYPRKWALNINLIAPKGYHLEPAGYAVTDPRSYYYRPDIRLTELSISAYRVPNKARFSYRAALLQTEWQKRSAGSFLYGGNIYTGGASGDSSLVPEMLQPFFPGADMHRIVFTGFGPGAGYAYTAVLSGHFFLTGSFIANLNVCMVKEQYHDGSTNRTNISPTTNFKTALGYNSALWNISASWTGGGIWFSGNAAEKDYFRPAGQYRFVFARRFDVRRRKE